MIYFAVIDTNVIVSSLLKENSIPGEILRLVGNGTIVPIYNDEIIEEYRDVLARNKFGFSLDKIDNVITNLMIFGKKLSAIEIQEHFNDKSDEKFYQIVMSSKRFVDSYLITGNLKHFPNKDYVVTPSEMISIINENNLS